MTTVAEALGGVVLITGGTGSFGSTFAKRLLAAGEVDEIRIFSRDELKQHEMRSALADSRLKFHIGDVRDYDSVHQAMRGVNYVFHAAALKQVPSCEFFPLEAVKTNVLGSSNVVQAAHANGASSVICLGTDKAVGPVNAMGMTKALMEKTAQAFARNNPETTTTVSTVRYGNVLCSRGSVVPLFVSQALSGQPITVTDPEMTRFLMSLDEAIGLVEHSIREARPGDLFIRKAPACTIGTLAVAVAELVGVNPQVEVIGTRHGEKLYETLATREEIARSEDHGDFLRVPVDARGLNYNEFFVEGDVRPRDIDEYHSHNTERLDVAAVKAILSELPDFRGQVAALRGTAT